MKIELVYPVDARCELERKTIELDESELIALSMSNKIGSEGHYYTITDKIFEELKDEKSMALILENEDQL